METMCNLFFLLQKFSRLTDALKRIRVHQKAENNDNRKY